ncbi:20838_t:CDS:2, partial [Dentiscutata erythropus]
VLEQDPQVFNRASAVKNLINNHQFWIDVEQLQNILGPVKQAVKCVEFRTTLLVDVFVELVKMAISIQEISVLYNNQFRRDFLEHKIYKKYVLKRALEIWMQLGGGWTSCKLLRTQMNLTQKNEDHIKTLAIRIHSISPHNAAYERTFSILGWYLGKRRTRLSIDRLELMAQMHSFLVENAKSELNYVNQNLCHEDFLSIFNKIANSMENETDLFDSDSVSFPEELEEDMEENIEESSEETDNSVSENSLNLEIGNFISLSSRLESNESSSLNEEIEHGNRDFDLNDLISDDSD